MYALVRNIGHESHSRISPGVTDSKFYSVMSLSSTDVAVTFVGECVLTLKRTLS